ncbi:hypothetical protein HEQ60_02315 [Haematospirillum sp. H1815]|uniref:hypothetical protein n=1 Tax=Haematospirillum sp. H1815 TaxID=2723108 RepID=UPI00143B7F8D|nr:hypothetical protein [Haematospirillum sp. H1815]NKD76606.1 hypothetical protein [Haematospirillum sp. H1815]
MLGFEINTAELARIADEFYASESVVQHARSRALHKTALYITRLVKSGLLGELQLSNAKALRTRLKSLKGDGASAGLWIGANAIEICRFRGKPRTSARGVSFRSQDFAGSFMARLPSGHTSVYHRSRKRRLPIEEQALPVHEAIAAFTETKAVPEISSVFYQYFSDEIRMRTVYGPKGRI